MATNLIIFANTRHGTKVDIDIQKMLTPPQLGRLHSYS
jgi:hypothetical protein